MAAELTWRSCGCAGEHDVDELDSACGWCDGDGREDGVDGWWYCGDAGETGSGVVTFTGEGVTVRLLVAYWLLGCICQ